jgi:hypothetical protein
MSWLHRVLGRDGTSQLEVDASFFAAATRIKPLTAIGHYRVNHRCAIIAAQAANSRLFELQNPGPNLIVLTRLVLKWFQTAAHTAAIEDSLDVFKATSFSAVDTTNTVTPTASKKRTSMANTTANLRGVTVAGAAAGMTGGTLTKDASSIAQVPLWLTLAFTDPSQRNISLLDPFDDVTVTHPLVLATNEGIEVENRVLLGAAAGSSLYIDVSFAEVTSF